MGDPVLAVDQEAVHVAQVLAVSRGHRARAADLDLALWDAIVGDAELLVVRSDVAFDVAVPVVGHGEDVLDAHIPGGVLDRELAEPEVRELLHGLAFKSVLDRTVERDLLLPARSRAGDWHETGQVRRVPWPHDEVRDALGGGIYDEVRELAELAVGA